MEGKSRFLKLDLILKFPKLQVAIQILLILKQFFEIQPVKVGEYNRFIIGGETKKKKVNFTEIFISLMQGCHRSS